PLDERFLDRVEALIRAGDLDHHIRSVDRLPQPARLLEGARAIVRELGRYLERNVPVAAPGRLVQREEQARCALDVLYRQRLIGVRGGDAAPAHCREGIVVVITARDGLLEDGRVRGDAANGLLLDQAC